MQEELRWLIGEPNSSNTRYTTTDDGDKYLKRAINEAYTQTVLAHLWPFRISVDETITTVDGQRNYTLPMWTGPVIMLRDTSNDRKLRIREERSYYSIHPDSSTEGKPTDYFFLGISTGAEPAATASAYTMDASTTTATVLDTELTATVANYYRDWQLYNIARKVYTRVTASAITPSESLTLEDLVASQASGDTYVLRRRLLQVALDPIPDASAETIVVHNFKIPKPMVSDYDVPVLPMGYELLPCYAAAGKILADDNPDRAQRRLDTANSMMSAMYYAHFREEYDSLPEIPVTNEQAFAGY